MLHLIKKTIQCASVIFALIFYCPSQAYSKEEINFGYNPDAAPISPHEVPDRTSPQILSFCGDLYNFLSKKYRLNQLKLEYTHRLNRFRTHPDMENSAATDRYGVECSAITITEARQKELAFEDLRGQFTRPFYSSEIAILAKDRETISKIIKSSSSKGDCSEESDSTCVRVGIINTSNDKTKVTTSTLTESIYPNTTVLVDVNSRYAALRHFEAGEIDALASDRILLEELVYFEKEGQDYEDTLAHKNYVIHSDHYSIEPYGVVVYNKIENDPATPNLLLDEINQWLLKKEGRAAIQKIDDYVSHERSEYIERKKDGEKWKENILFLSLLIASASFATYLYVKRASIRSSIEYKMRERIAFNITKIQTDIGSDGKLVNGNVIYMHSNVNGSEVVEENGKLMVKTPLEEFLKGASNQAGGDIASAIFAMVGDLIKQVFMFGGAKK